MKDTRLPRFIATPPGVAPDALLLIGDRVTPLSLVDDAGGVMGLAPRSPPIASAEVAAPFNSLGASTDKPAADAARLARFAAEVSSVSRAFHGREDLAASSPQRLEPRAGATLSGLAADIQARRHPPDVAAIGQNIRELRGPPSISELLAEIRYLRARPDLATIYAEIRELREMTQTMWNTRRTFAAG